MLSGHTVVVGITGGIAAYKSAELVRGLKKLNAEVHVIMTKNACKFITPLTMQTLSQNPVITDMFAETSEWQVEHVSLAKKANIVLVVPATANIIGKVANGIADDMLTTTIMATKAPVVFAGSMNSNMYENQIVQENISKLKNLGYFFVEPEFGFLACNEEGKGRLAQLDDIIEKSVGIVKYKQDLVGKTVLITAGPTKEYIDPVRFITNGSTGKMGYALAKVALARGAKVILVSGPVALKKPYGAEVINVESAGEMFEEVTKRYQCADIIIMSAAVADYRSKTISKSKIKKVSNEITIELVKNNDILKHVGERKENRIVVGFSMETNDLEDYAVKKLNEKNLDMIVANYINVKDAGFGTDTNIVKIINKNGDVKDIECMAKVLVAEKIFDEVVKLKA